MVLLSGGVAWGRQSTTSIEDSEMIASHSGFRRLTTRDFTPVSSAPVGQRCLLQADSHDRSASVCDATTHPAGNVEPGVSADRPMIGR